MARQNIDRLRPPKRKREESACHIRISWSWAAELLTMPVCTQELMHTSC